MAKGKWLALDVDYTRDIKFRRYMALSGSSKAKQRENRLRYLDLLVAWTMTDSGEIYLEDPGDMMLLVDVVGLSGKKLDDWLSTLAESGLISKDGLALGRVGCERSRKESAKRDKRKEASIAGNEAKSAKRQSRRSNVSDTVSDSVSDTVSD